MFNNSEVKGAHFRILLEKVPIFAKNVRFLYHREANKKRHPPLKVAPMCAKAHVIKHSAPDDPCVYASCMIEICHYTTD